ncbi:hypothetical protein ABZ342_17350 [Amycolatopsis sp. NPDC005961]
MIAGGDELLGNALRHTASSPELRLRRWSGGKVVWATLAVSHRS